MHDYKIYKRTRDRLFIAMNQHTHFTIANSKKQLKITREENMSFVKYKDMRETIYIYEPLKTFDYYEWR